ncbi:MAG TPA: sulfite exporter TauE/SafE family protein [Candidatus Desulfobacillus sp.]|nr:sulfite exporter TauE/SafE family protein [Candidatus Desulfobacillus sp.]
MELSLDTIASAAVVITLAYTIFGLTGFGSSITAMPFLAVLLPLRIVVPLMIIFDFSSGLLVGVRNRHDVDRRELMRLVPFALVGMGIGVTLLVKVPERPLLLLLGVSVFLYSVWSLLKKSEPKPIATGWAAPLATVGGVFTALYGTGGPIYSIYLARRIRDKLTLRATISMLIVINGVTRLAMYIGAGLYAQEGLLRLALILLPCAMAGLFIGSRLHRRLSSQQVIKAIWLILIVAGGRLIVHSLWE